MEKAAQFVLRAASWQREPVTVCSRPSTLAAHSQRLGHFALAGDQRAQHTVDEAR